jgi:hypothetical protein
VRARSSAKPKGHRCRATHGPEEHWPADAGGAAGRQMEHRRSTASAEAGGRMRGRLRLTNCTCECDTRGRGGPARRVRVPSRELKGWRDAERHPPPVHCRFEAGGGCVGGHAGREETPGACRVCATKMG